MQHDLDPSEAVTLAAHWLATTPHEQFEGPVIPAIRKRFPLTVAEACEAAAMAGKIRGAQNAKL
ncbi:hypothetical protein IMCC20628_01847 [Hoeflea sp. IMCC20628]|uniref:hypothetical protein n=1 Tax=Hoeflea sp. IMCC20628 TaxID=1620421 RepID=UPI00063ACC99|nr:hypothetical protein [Hoeflea sp. IMCC20628]AKI00554.1 hypothetical protein IMCC20628_01847 [Hoeflea sp. IMCC20628]